MNLNQFSFVTKLSCRALNMQKREREGEKKNESRCDLTAAIRYELVNFIRVRFIQLAIASCELNPRVNHAATIARGNANKSAVSIHKTAGISQLTWPFVPGESEPCELL